MSWLVVKGRIHEAVQQYKFVAKINNRQFKVRVETCFRHHRSFIIEWGT